MMMFCRLLYGSILMIAFLSMATFAKANGLEKSYLLNLNAINIEPLRLINIGASDDTTQCKRTYNKADKTSLTITFPAGSNDKDICSDVVLLADNSGSFLAWVTLSKSQGIVSARFLDGYAAREKWCLATIDYSNQGEVALVTIDGKSQICVNLKK